MSAIKGNTNYILLKGTAWLYQPYQHLIQLQNLKMRGLHLSPSIECVLDVLAGWRLMMWSDSLASYSSAAKKIMSSCS
jgi:hypothetical protein